MNINISKRNLIITIAVFSACVALYTFIFSLSINIAWDDCKKEMYKTIDSYKMMNSHETQDNVKIEDVIKEIKEASGYVLLEHEGKIGIYDSYTKKLLKVLDVYINTLPIYDRTMLSDGINADSLSELVSLVEDYTS